MTTTRNMKQPTQRNKFLLAKLWIFIIILLVFVLLSGSRVILTSSSPASIHENMMVEPVLSSTATAKAISASEPTTTTTPTLSSTATTTPTLLSTTTTTPTLPSTATITPTPSSTQPTTIWVSGYRVNLRTGPGTNFSAIRKLAYDEQLLMLGRLSDNSWLYVKTPDGEEGWITMSWVYLARVNLYHDDYPFRMSPPTETSTPVVLDGIEGRWIDVDLSEQMLRAYDGADLVASFLVSTGIDLYPTETGQYHIYVKYLSSPMRGDDYYLPDVPYSLYYSGDFSIHGTYWHHNFGTPMSHGCINMDINDAKWLYHWSSIGTLVNIHR
jgi:lipoprotein-anchoring transpeptidase ErfK/SrfK